MPKYRLDLEVEIFCPSVQDQPELTITLEAVKRALISTQSRGGYAVCDPEDGHKRTASMRVMEIKSVRSFCEKCGHQIYGDN